MLEKRLMAAVQNGEGSRAPVERTALTRTAPQKTTIPIHHKTNAALSRCLIRYRRRARACSSFVFCKRSVSSSSFKSSKFRRGEFHHFGGCRLFGKEERMLVCLLPGVV